MSMIALAILLGGTFGFVLDRVGASQPDCFIEMLRLGNLRLMKALLLAVGIASLLTFAGLLAGMVDPSHLVVRTTHLGVLTGGILFGLGLPVAGYCPATGLAAAGSGRVDAWFFLAGGLLGAGAFGLSDEFWSQIGVLAPIVGGKTTLGQIDGSGATALFDPLPGEWIGLAIGLALAALALLIPDTLRTTPAVRPLVPPGEARTIGNR